MPNFKVTHTASGKDFGTWEAESRYKAIVKARGNVDEQGPIIVHEWTVDLVQDD